MSDAFTDSYRISREDQEAYKEYNKRIKAHEVLIKTSQVYQALTDNLREQQDLLRTTQRAINVMDAQREELLKQYIDKQK
jgi:hypothetical protein